MVYSKLMLQITCIAHGVLTSLSSVSLYSKTERLRQCVVCQPKLLHLSCLEKWLHLLVRERVVFITATPL